MVVVLLPRVHHSPRRALGPSLPSPPPPSSCCTTTTTRPEPTHELGATWPQWSLHVNRPHTTIRMYHDGHHGLMMLAWPSSCVSYLSAYLQKMVMSVETSMGSLDQFSVEKAYTVS